MAFTLIELLVVIAIVSILMAIAFPAIAVMARLTRGGASETTIGVAARTAAAYAGKPKRSLTDPSNPANTFNSNGAAVLFTPNGDIRILQTDLLAFDTSDAPLQPNRFGYEDIPNRDYINLPDNAGVVGILRVSGGSNGIELITPPFAIHFDQYGQATTGYAAGDDRHMVFYDSNYDGQYNITDDRSTDPNYNPNEWNNKSDEWVDTRWDDARLRPQLPFERIETVVGVLMYQIPDFNSGDGPPRDLTASSGYLNSNARNWLLQTDADGRLVNAKAIFFSRNSGSILKEYR